MWLGLPMQVETLEPGFAWVCGRGERRRVDVALVGNCQPGDWLLVFLDSARELLDAAVVGAEPAAYEQRTLINPETVAPFCRTRCFQPTKYGHFHRTIRALVNRWLA